MISAIVAVDKNWGIGYNGDLLAHIPEDLKRFKELTSGEYKAVVMGRKTWDSLPKKPLPNRKNIIITTQTNYYNSQDQYFWRLGQTKLVMKQQKGWDFFVIGGGQIYEKLLPYCDKVYVTKINKEYENVDTYFPNLDLMEDWAPAVSSAIYDYKDFTYQFLEYDRI